MDIPIIVTFIILTILFIILSSLGFSLFYLLKDQSGRTRTVRALSVRVGLSITLFVCLLIAIHQGWMIPNPPAL